MKKPILRCMAACVVITGIGMVAPLGNNAHSLRIDTMRRTLEQARHEIGILLLIPIKAAKNFAAANNMKTVFRFGSRYSAHLTFMTLSFFTNEIAADSTIGIFSSLDGDILANFSRASRNRLNILSGWFKDDNAGRGREQRAYLFPF